MKSSRLKKAPETKAANFNLTRPAIRNKVKRTSALDLQKVLKSQKYYSGSLDGLYGKGTGKCFPTV